jgi:hypothetical protein
LELQVRKVAAEPMEKPMIPLRTWLLVGGLAQAYPLTPNSTDKDAIRHGMLITPHGVWDAQ